MATCQQMPFTYEAYRGLLALLKKHGYEFKGYDDHEASRRPVILRHDIDFDIGKALAMAELEADEGVRSTYFVLLRTDFYNPLERRNAERLQRVAALGHGVGLHFDETQYEGAVDAPAAIRREADVLEGLLGLPVECVSMHRPSKAALEADWSIPGMANSYSKELFEGFEYVSDSRRRWRKPVREIVQGGGCSRLHILTHPFWYNETEASLGESLARFAGRASADRMSSLDRNFTDLDEAIDPGSLVQARLASLRCERFETNRLVLRPLRLEDAADMFEYTSRAEVSRFLNWHPHREAGEARAWIASKLSRPEPDDLLLGMELARDRRLIGTVRAYRFDALERSCEISYALNPDHQGCGYMTEALQRLVGICLEELRMKRVVACIDADNAASEHVARRLGMAQAEGGDFAASIKGESRLQHTYALERGTL